MVQQDWKFIISLCNTLTWFFLLPPKVRQAERFAGEQRGARVYVLPFSTLITIYSRVEQ